MPFLWMLLRAGGAKALAVSGIIGAATAISDAKKAADKKAEQRELRQALGLPGPETWTPPSEAEAMPETKTSAPAFSTTLGTTLGVLAAATLIVGAVRLVSRRS